MSELNNSTWEISKENIQPLRVGRNMASLSQSLRYEDHARLDPALEAKYLDLLSKAEPYYNTGDDPVVPYIEVFTFLEQNRLISGDYAVKKKKLEMQACRRLLPLARYKNDLRFLTLYIRTLKDYPAHMRIRILQASVDQGLGDKTSLVYITLAEDYEECMRFREASELLKVGISKNAEPLQILQEALSNLEYRVAEKLARGMQLTVDVESFSDRAFGHGVTVGSCNEAPSVRHQLSPASASNSLPASKRMRKMEIYTDEGSYENQNKSAPINPVREIDQIGREVENQMRPSKWNRPEERLDKLECMEDGGKIPIFEDSESFHIPQAYNVDTKPILRERTMEDIAIDLDNDQWSNKYGWSTEQVMDVANPKVSHSYYENSVNTSNCTVGEPTDSKLEFKTGFEVTISTQNGGSTYIQSNLTMLSGQMQGLQVVDSPVFPTFEAPTSNHGMASSTSNQFKAPSPRGFHIRPAVFNPYRSPGKPKAQIKMSQMGLALSPTSPPASAAPQPKKELSINDLPPLPVTPDTSPYPSPPLPTSKPTASPPPVPKTGRNRFTFSPAAKPFVPVSAVPTTVRSSFAGFSPAAKPFVPRQPSAHVPILYNSEDSSYQGPQSQGPNRFYLEDECGDAILTDVERACSNSASTNVEVVSGSAKCLASDDEEDDAKYESDEEEKTTRTTLEGNEYIYQTCDFFDELEKLEEEEEDEFSIEEIMARNRFPDLTDIILKADADILLPLGIDIISGSGTCRNDVRASEVDSPKECLVDGPAENSVAPKASEIGIIAAENGENLAKVPLESCPIQPKDEMVGVPQDNVLTANDRLVLDFFPVLLRRVEELEKEMKSLREQNKDLEEYVQEQNNVVALKMGELEKRMKVQLEEACLTRENKRPKTPAQTPRGRSENSPVRTGCMTPKQQLKTQITEALEEEASPVRYPRSRRESLRDLTDDVYFQPAEDYTEAIFKQPLDQEIEFNISNITRALNLLPQPDQCSTPEPQPNVPVREEPEPGLYAQRRGLFSGVSGGASCERRSNFNQSLLEVAQNLSTIQETSKESRGSTTGSSGSTTMHTNTTRGASGSTFSSSAVSSNYNRWSSATTTPNPYSNYPNSYFPQSQ